MIVIMGACSYSDIRDSFRHLSLKDPRPCLEGLSGAEHSTMLASLMVEVVADINNPSEISYLHMARAIGTRESKHVEAIYK
jgi:hypothetical protein